MHSEEKHRDDTCRLCYDFEVPQAFELTKVPHTLTLTLEDIRAQQWELNVCLACVCGCMAWIAKFNTATYYYTYLVSYQTIIKRIPYAITQRDISFKII